jgi:hypothetical protein
MEKSMSAADEGLALRDAMDAFHGYLREAQQLSDQGWKSAERAACRRAGS